MFRKPDGEAQHTGWTGYDCATPICVQARRFILNVGNGGKSAWDCGEGKREKGDEITDPRLPDAPLVRLR